MSTSGFHTFVFKKDLATIRRYSEDTAKLLEEIYYTHGSHAAYCSAQAVKKVLQSAQTSTGVAGSNWQAEMRECSYALADTRRAVETFMYDTGIADYRALRD